VFEGVATRRVMCAVLWAWGLTISSD